MARYLLENGPWSQLVELAQIDLRTFEPGTKFEILEGLKVTPVVVPHRDEFSDTMAFRIEGPDRTLLFVPDIDSWDKTAGLLESLLEGVDVAFLDATFYDGREQPGRDLSQIGHPLMVDTMRRLGERARSQPGLVRFIHLNHTNPVLHDPTLRREIEREIWRAVKMDLRSALSDKDGRLRASAEATVRTRWLPLLRHLAW